MAQMDAKALKRGRMVFRPYLFTNDEHNPYPLHQRQYQFDVSRQARKATQPSTYRQAAQNDNGDEDDSENNEEQHVAVRVTKHVSIKNPARRESRT